MKKIVLIGAGGHCKVIIDIIKSKNEYEIIGITSRNSGESKICDVPIIGNDDLLKQYLNSGIEYAFIAVGGLEDIKLRNKLLNMVKSLGFKIPVLIHDKAIVSVYSSIGEGTCVMPGAIINAGATIGDNCIINSGAIVEHDCIISDNTHISPNASIAGGVKIGKDSHVGIGSSIIQNLSIGCNVTIGAGAVVVEDVENNLVVVGTPAKVIKRKLE